MLDKNYQSLVTDYLLAEYESIGWERRDYKMAAVLGRIITHYENRPKCGAPANRAMSIEDIHKRLSSSKKAKDPGKNMTPQQSDEDYS